MDNNLFQRLKELIEQNQNIGIIVSPNPTFDGMAAGLGLYLSLVQMKKNVSIVCPTDPTVAVSSLVGVDKVGKSFGGGEGNDFIVSFPYKEGEIEKVSYDVEGNKLRIVIKPGPQGLSFTSSDVQFDRGGQAAGGTLPSLVFFIGIADMQSLGFQKPAGVTIVNIDNRSNNTKYGDIVHVDSRFSSLSEEVADFLTLLEPQIELDRDTSQNLLSGILAATNDFQNGQGSYLAFEMAGILMKKGAVRSASGNASPVTPAMPAANYFPPQQPVQQAQVQPTVQEQPQQNVPTSNFGTMFVPSQPIQASQPVAAPVTQPEPVQPPQQPVQPVQNTQNTPPPADWLTPKVYKGSTVL